jgi:hypothetical protein
MEEEAAERTANRPKTALDEIYKRWLCVLLSCKNYQKHCWVDPADSKHYSFDTQHARRWVNAIPVYATIEHPSEALRMVLVRKANDNKRKQTHVQNATSSHGNTNNYFNIAMPNTGMVGFTPNASRQSSSVYSPQQTPRRRHRNPSTSPVISNPDGNVQLDSYFEWLIKKFPAIKQKLLSAKEQLHERDIDLRTIQLLDHEQL